MPTHAKVISRQKGDLMANWEHLLLVKRSSKRKKEGMKPWGSSDKNNSFLQCLPYFLGSGHSKRACLLKAFLTDEFVCVNWFPDALSRHLCLRRNRLEGGGEPVCCQKDQPGTESGDCLCRHTLISGVLSCAASFDWRIAHSVERI